MTESPPSRRPTREPAIKPGRIRFSYPVETYRHHYANDDLVLSHAVVFLSAVFPPDEDFFVRSVKHYRADRAIEMLQPPNRRTIDHSQGTRNVRIEHSPTAAGDLGYSVSRRKTGWRNGSGLSSLRTTCRLHSPRTR